jgi:16S rRNA (guanine966-N2)-methyltransferase
LKANIAALGVREKTRVYKKDALPFAGALPSGKFDIAFADPPYESKMLDRLIESWHRQKFSTILAIEHARVHVLPTIVKPQHTQIFDDSAISVYRL